MMQRNATGDEPFECVPCAPDSYCPLAAVGEVDLSKYAPASQAHPYPISPASTNFDDIIITNAFQLSTSNRSCLLVSPIFWTLLVLAIACLILIIMFCLHRRPGKRHHFKRLARAFRHTDLIGEGEMWIGGLFSFALLVLITFGFWFGSEYLRQYPIETAADANFACDKSLRNAKFSSSLQLLAVLRSEEEKPIFELLDQQSWTLSLDLIQTGFQCNEIHVQVSLILTLTLILKILIDACLVG